MALQRAGYRFHGWRPTRWPARLLRALLRPFLVATTYVCSLVTKNELTFHTRFEGGVCLSDRGHIVLGARSVGTGTVIHERVTIGHGAQVKGTPEIGRGVWIGHDCVVFGAIRLGDGVTLLPGTVVSRSVPPNTVLVGNPPRVVRAPCS